MTQKPKIFNYKKFNIIILKMIADTFQIAENEQNLQYYAFVRQVMQAKQINYWIGNPSVQIINGSIFFKSNSAIELIQDRELESYQEYLKQYKTACNDQNKEQKKINKTLALLGIPNSKTPIQVCEKLGAYLNWITEVRVVKTNHFKYYAMLLLLKDEQKSEKLFSQILGDQYNGLQIQKILIREMTQITYTHVQTLKADIQPLFQHRKKSNIPVQDHQQKLSPQEIFKMSHENKQIQKQGVSPRKKEQHLKMSEPLTPSSKHNDQETSCTICFEQTQGTLISILCCHYFHVKCLSQWKQNICPLCRYHQQPPVIKFCQKCNQCQGLWICLVCGVRLCCGEDHNILGSSSHIYEHYLQSHHKLSMDVETKFIFDASQPAFLHQMFYKEVMKNDTSGLQSDSNNKKGKKTKLSQKISEYEQSISQQMQKQRSYFEENISKQIKKRKQFIKQKKKIITQLQNQIAQIDKLSLEIDKKKQQLQNQSANKQKQLKNLSQNQKELKQVSEKNKKDNKQKQQQEKAQIRKLDILIAEKKQQLKDFRRNKELSAKIKSNVGKDKIQSTLIFDIGGKDSKKKKK